MLNRNKHLIEDLQSRLSTANLLAWIEEEGDSLSTFGCAPTGHIHFSKQLLLARKILQIREGAVVGKACISPSAGEFYDICVSASISPLRLRSAIAHEIGHTYWFKPGGGGKPLSPLQRTLGGDPAIEFLCDRFAEALLIPKNALSEFYECKSIDKEPPLHLVSLMAETFRVEEQLVVRRIYPILWPSLAAVICLRPESNERENTTWTTSWCLRAERLYEKQAPLGFRMPLATPRRVPSEMLPDVEAGITSSLSLDARWWESIKDVPLKSASKPLSRLTDKGSKTGFACRSNNRIYLGLLGPQ